MSLTSLRGTVVAAILVALAVPPLVAQESDSTTNDAPARRVITPDQSTQRPGFRPVLPRPVDSDDLALIDSVIVLSASQSALLRDLHRAYLSDDDALRRDEYARLVEIGQDLYAANPTTDPVAAAAMAEFLEECDRVGARLERLAERLFLRFETFLADDQSVRLIRAHGLRARQRARRIGDSFPPAEVDVTRMLHEVTAAHEITLETSVRNEIESILDRYDIDSVAAANRRFSAARRASARFSIAMAGAHAASAARPSEARAIYAAAYDEILRENDQVVGAMDEMHRVNRRAVEALVAGLPSLVGDHLADQFASSAYPAVNPDPYDLREVFDWLTERAPDSTAIIGAIRITWADEQARLARQMIAAMATWNLRVIRERTVDAEGYASYRQRMLTFDAARSTNSETALAGIADAARIDPAVLSEASERFHARRQELLDARLHRAVDDATWPFPYER